MESAKGSTYLPQIVNCRPVEADGLFTADLSTRLAMRKSLVERLEDLGRSPNYFG